MDIIRENRTFWLYIIGIIVLFVILLIAGSIFLRGDKVEVTEDNTDEIPFVFNETPPFILDLDKKYTAEFDTNFGKFKADLYTVNAPLNTNNFVYLTQRRYYDGLIVHRMIPNVLMQTGSRLTINEDPNDDINGNPGYTVNDEINWDSIDLSEDKRKLLEKEGFESNDKVVSKHMEKYSLVMANADKTNTAGSQFFIVLADDSDPRLGFLTGRHTVIGKIFEGTEIVDEMRKVDVDVSNQDNPRPINEIKFNSVKIFVE